MPQGVIPIPLALDSLLPCQFQRLVKQVTPVDGPESGWDVTSSQATGGGEQETERFDAIMVCSG